MVGLGSVFFPFSLYSSTFIDTEHATVPSTLHKSKAALLPELLQSTLELFCRGIGGFTQIAGVKRR